ARLLPRIARPAEGRERAVRNDPARHQTRAAVRQGTARWRYGCGGRRRTRALAAVGERAVPAVQAGRPEAGRTPPDPVLRVGQPRPVRDDRLDAAGALTDANHLLVTVRKCSAPS